jgi:sporulation protein YlmC with PRC-barrel domain
MKKTITISILLLVGVLLAVNGFAQQQQKGKQAQQGQQQMQSGEQLRWAQRSSDVLDKKIVSRDGKELGKAENLIIGKDGKIEYIILSKGGLLGMGEEKVAVPWDKVRTTPNVDQLMADVSESEIQKYTEEGQESGGRESQRTAQQGKQQPSMPLAQVDAQRAEEFMDRKVTGRNGEELGRVKDILTSEDGQPLYIAVQEKSSRMLHPVPAQLVRTNPQDKSLSADLDKQAFMNSPRFDESQISEPQQWEPQVRGYYQNISGGAQMQPQGMGQQQRQFGAQDRRQQQRGDQQQLGGQSRQQRQQSTIFSSATELMDKKVKNDQGQELGQVEDLIITRNGQVAYLVISKDRVMGMGGESIPIPFRNANLNQQQDAVILSNIEKQQLENAPSISENDIYKLEDPQFQREVFSYYGSQQQRGQGGYQSGMGGFQQQRGPIQQQQQRPMPPMHQQQRRPMQQEGQFGR